MWVATLQFSVMFIDASVFLDCQGDIHINSFSAYWKNERLIKLYSTVVTLFKVEHVYFMCKLCKELLHVYAVCDIPQLE